ncbi:MAG: hypothetical protein NVSMB6_21580 [Burkholderiaceae bacterium]
MSGKQLLIAVLTLTPLFTHATEYRVVEHPRQECWMENATVHSPNISGVIIGGIGGGLLSSQVGRGNGRTVATVAGAVTGAIVGDRLAGGSTAQTQSVERCRTVIDRDRVPVHREVRYIEVDDDHEHHDNGSHKGGKNHRGRKDDRQDDDGAGQRGG